MASDVFDEGEEAAPSPDGAALSLALSAAAHDPAVATKAALYLEVQTRLARLQAEDLRKEDVIRHWALRVRHINELLKLAFGLSAAIVVTAIAFGILVLIWNAHEATGLVIQPLKAPPDFAARGLDGTVLAQRLLDKLNVYVRDADKWSFRAAGDVSGNWGNDSKVEIPETGISVFELSRFLRQRLGHETSMSGELYRTANGIALTVRVGSDPGVTFEGSDQDIDALLSRAAMELLRQTQPYRYVWALYDEGKPASALVPVAKGLVDSASDTERPWLRSAWEELLEFSGDFSGARMVAQETVALEPSFPFGGFDLSPAEWATGHLQGALVHIETAERLLTGNTRSDLASAGVPFLIDNCRSFAGDLRGAYSDAVAADRAEAATGTYDLSVSAPGSIANDLALDHDLGTARAVLAEHPALSDDILLQPQYISVTGLDMPNFHLRAAEGDWAGARNAIERTDSVVRGRNNVNDVRETFVWPWLAYALARTGALKDAGVLIAKTPLDCTLCLEMRGRIAEAGGDMKSAAAWYRRGIADAPSLPLSETDWGAMLMRHGDLNGAIEHFHSANRKSPHFADALELWGEALMAQNRSDLALEKFAESARYAPQWGRLHLKWSEALSYAGHRSEAHAQFAVASGLGLTPAERSELESDRKR